MMPCSRAGPSRGRAGFAVPAVSGGAFGEAGLVGVEGGQADVAGVRGGDERDLLVTGWRRPGAGLAVWAEGSAGAAVAEHPGVAGVVQNAQDRGVGQRSPVQLSFVGPVAVPAGEAQPGDVEFFDDRMRGAGGLEGGEQVADGVLDGLVGVADDAPRRVVGQPDGQRSRQFAAAGFVEDAAVQPGARVMQFGFAELPFHSQEHAVVEVGGVVEAVFVADQRAG
jgi:hypothetical protein